MVYHPVYLQHDTGRHIENGQRLEAVMAYLQQTGLIDQLTAVPPRPATTDELSKVHDERYIARIRAVAEEGGGWLDMDTVMSSGSYQAALYAAGGLIAATEAVLRGEVACAFALVRPPGHHARRRQAMGFCLFNNIAVAACSALSAGGLERVAIVDYDVHHGNATQETFYHEPRVLYVSLHQSPHYPGTGDEQETGSGAGQGTTVNLPLPAGCGDAEYGMAFDRVVLPVVRRFRPQLVLVSAGYDTHWADPLAGMQLSVRGFARMVTALRELADDLCRGRVVITLEGGYHPEALPASVAATFAALLGRTEIADPLGPPPHPAAAPDIAPLLAAAGERHGL